MERPTLPTWLLSDGHAGNVRQAQALARALGVEVTREWILQPNTAARWLAPRIWPGAGKAFGREFAKALASPPALAIGCGRQAALATRLLRKRGAKAVQILDPRVSPRHWNWVVTPQHDGLRGRNVISVQGSLNDVDDDWLGRARAQFPQLLDYPGPRVALLVGGPSPHLADEALLLGSLTPLADAVREIGGSLLATTSRRTPDSWRKALYRARAGVPGLLWRDADDGPNPYAGLLACSDLIVCTPDSVNMLSEAAATRVPVLVLAPEVMRGRPAKFLRGLQDSGRVRPFLRELPDDIGAMEPLRETARVAAMLREQLALSA